MVANLPAHVDSSKPNKPNTQQVLELLNAIKQSKQLNTDDKKPVDVLVPAPLEMTWEDKQHLLEVARRTPQSDMRRDLWSRRKQECRELAEQALSHLLRTPELLMTAKSQVTTRHFTALGCYDLAEVWSCATKLMEQQGADIVKNARWPVMVEKAMAQKDLSKGWRDDLFGDGQFNKGFFSRLNAMPATDFEEGQGPGLVNKLAKRGFLLEPLQKLIHEHVDEPLADESALAEHVSRIIQNYQDHSVLGAKPMFMTPEEFANTEFKIEWLVPKILVANQPCIVGGPSKSLKTSVMIDLAVSIGAGDGTQFLGKFEVKNPGMPVGFISGESGGATIKNTFERVCQTRGLKLAHCNVYPEFRLPKLGQSKEVKRLASYIRRLGLKVIIIDPIYLSLLAGNKTAKAENVFDMGPLLAEIGDACIEAGATPILVHHTVKRLPPPVNGIYAPIDREDLAMSGFTEFARQWMLLNRRMVYKDGTGEHDLWLRIGGSAGFGSLWGVKIKEGVIDDNFQGRHWNVKVYDQKELDEIDTERKEEQRTLSDAKKDRELKDRLLKAMEAFPNGETMTAIQQAAGISSNTSVGHLFHQMTLENSVESARVVKNRGQGKGTLTGYKLRNAFLNPVIPVATQASSGASQSPADASGDTMVEAGADATAEPAGEALDGLSGPEGPRPRQSWGSCHEG